MFCPTKVYLYLNNFDEYVRMRNITGDFKLNLTLYSKVTEDFFNHRYQALLHKDQPVNSFIDELNELSD